ncbi:hypothetical protein [Streptomyces violascens]|uniref:DUF4913 domain-containing protein n=1 Tax=Streptomyces violascens TaxID=67381 RepID=A0ABQ3QL72_9ACTN|nr:hypothetical protein [Streptomyces violascens]GGU44605.1 hypothetical protein GCM10010289_76490 [Streptomyces violascens]GHI38020.1 hypothetical protein Sviol_24280 [Streptomyces violascens]
MSDPLDDPAALWPAQPGATPPQPEPQRWVWAAMEPPERRARLRELAVWVTWLRTTFELHNQIPHCWYRHSPVVEHLTALYAGWLRTYAGEQGAGRELAEADWINTLHNFTPRLQLAACATGRHQEPPPLVPPPPGTAEAFEVFLVTSDATTTGAQHPAAAELQRRMATFEAPL